MFIRLTDNFFVAPQITLEDLNEAQAQGLTRIINNRPDEEVPDQPGNAEMAAQAQNLGLDYHYIPINPGHIREHVDILHNVLASPQPTLAFCRSGTRSTLLWAMVQAKNGAAFSDVAAMAAQGGYDISPIAAIYDALLPK